MKKAVALLLVIIMCLSICSCGSKKNLMDDKELKSGLWTAIFDKVCSDLFQKRLLISLTKNMSLMVTDPQIKSIEETDSGSYCVIGELYMRWKNEQTGEFSDEYAPFTAYISSNGDGEYSCDDLELEFGKDSLLKD